MSFLSSEPSMSSPSTPKNQKAQPDPIELQAEAELEKTIQRLEDIMLELQLDAREPLNDLFLLINSL